MNVLSLTVAFGAAVMFGWSTAAMHHGASGAPPSSGGWRGLLSLLRHVVRQWRWLTGMIASLLGLALHAVALRTGSLAVVQPVVVSGLVFSFLFRSLLDRQLPPFRTVLWSGVTSAALGVFLWAARATTGASSPNREAAVAVLAVSALLAVTCWWLSSRTSASPSGVLLGAGAGVIFGLTAGTLKATAAEHGVHGLLTGWPLYVLIVLGVVGFLANQTAYRRPLASAVPALNVMNPLVALAYGAIAFQEKPAEHLSVLILEAASLAVVLTGVVQLARAEAATAHVTELAEPEAEAEDQMLAPAA